MCAEVVNAGVVCAGMVCAGVVGARLVCAEFVCGGVMCAGGVCAGVVCSAVLCAGTEKSSPQQKCPLATEMSSQLQICSHSYRNVFSATEMSSRWCFNICLPSSRPPSAVIVGV